MKLLVFSICLCLALTHAAPIDKLRQQAARSSKLASADLAMLEKQAEIAFEIEKTSNKADITEAVAVDNLAQSEVEEAAAQNTQNQAGQQTQQADKQTTTTQTTSSSQIQQQQQQAAATTTQTTQAQTPTTLPPSAKDTPKPTEWQDAVLVEDLTVERAGANKDTKYIGANMKTTKMGAPKAASFLQIGDMYYYPVHPAFIQQAQSMQHKTGRAAEGVQGLGDFGTPLYYAPSFGLYDGAGPQVGYGDYGYSPYTSGFNPMYTQGAGAGYVQGAGYGQGGYANYPFGGSFGYMTPSPPPLPVNLPLPPYIQP